jgi:dipeptidyl aminopeptidase/acylaminoacyl peptidase
LVRFEPHGGRIEPLTAAIPWDVERLDASSDHRMFAFVTNQGGRGVAHTFDAASGQLRDIAAPAGSSVIALQLSPDGRRLALTFTSSSETAAIDVVDLASGNATRWARSDTAGLDTARFGATQVVTWNSFDGRAISGLVTRPDARRFPGRRPVLIQIHGGPEAQARIGFLGRENYLVNELGITLIAPNVRGSSGFGKTFVGLDDGRKREDAVRDIGALLDWIATQPDLDASRVAVYGGSYGGYMVHAVAVHYSARIRAAIAVVGISHFVSFLERTETYRRDLRRAEYGDERDPAMREFLDRISPLTNASRIKVPLFVIHGRNDPRVAVSEAEQIARTVRGNGVPVWLMIADNEGHGFAKKENADYAFYARVLFLQRHLLRGG